MINIIEYAILSYYPSIFSQECINIGVLAHDIKNDYYDFAYIKKWQRVGNFDDEVNVNGIRYAVEGIKEHFRPNIFKGKRYEGISEYAKYFVNELRFSPVMKYSSENFLEAFDIIKKIHLKFDYDKKDRLNENETKKYIKNHLFINNNEFNSKPIKGRFDENIICDFVINDNKCIKIFNLNEKNKRNLIHSFKAWAFTIQKMSDYKFFFFITNEDLVDKDFLNTVRRILESDNSKIIFDIEKIVDISFNSNAS